MDERDDSKTVTIVAGPGERLRVEVPDHVATGEMIDEIRATGLLPLWAVRQAPMFEGRGVIAACGTEIYLDEEGS